MYLYNEVSQTWLVLKKFSESSKALHLAIKTSLVIIALSLSMVIAGSGNLNAFKLFRAIRKSSNFMNEASCFVSYFSKLL
jgi:anaphase-promoting complex subunit 1